jgi:FkbM family methyltransferase
MLYSVPEASKTTIASDPHLTPFTMNLSARPTMLYSVPEPSKTTIASDPHLTPFTMNLSALFQNYLHAKRVCRHLEDQFKFLYWLYSKSVPFGPQGNLRLQVRLSPPVGDATLTVRCNGGSDAFIFSEVFQHRYYDFDLATPPVTVLDLGANIGLAALFFARKYPQARIACVEPIPGNLAILQANLDSNGVSAQVFAKAVTVDDQSALMLMSKTDFGHKVSGVYNGPFVGTGATLQVDGISVPTLLKELAWERIGLLKVDIEGYESILLRERYEWLERVDAICIECHGEFDINDLREVAQRFGFAPPRQLAGIILMVKEPSQLTTPGLTAA